MSADDAAPMEVPSHPEHVHKPKHNWTLILCVVILAVVILNGFVAWYHFLVEAPRVNAVLNPEAKQTRFELIRPDIAALEVEDFLKIQHQGTISMVALKKNILEVVDDPMLTGEYAVYVEDLNTGAWMGLNEREKFFPASLAKMPIVVAVYKKIQDGLLSPSDNVVITAEDIDARFGTLAFAEPGTEYTINELIQYALVKSDNTAARTLLHQLSADDVMEARLAMGLDWPKEKEDVTRASPKEYANMFRSLYLSTYLRRVFSNEILSLLADTPFDAQLAAGLPANVRLSHKYGVTPDEESTHDCGIVYLETHDYLICAMSRGASVEEANKVIRAVSKVTYEHMSEELS